MLSQVEENGRMEIENKKEYFQSSCNPWKKILGEI
jgi:hypothetical protein